MNSQTPNDEFQTIQELCSKGRFDEARPKLEAFIGKYPEFSEAYRVKAQLMMDAGQIDDAIDVNIEALKHDPKNAWALVLMGNLYSRYKGDFATAQTYYDKVLEYCPENTIALNNVAGLMMERKDYQRAIPIFEGILKNDKKYANSYYGLAICRYYLKDFRGSFDAAVQGSLMGEIRTENPKIMDELHGIMMGASAAMEKSTNYLNVVLGVKDEYEADTHIPVHIEEDKDLKVSAMAEYNVSHNRNYQLIKYNPQLKYTEHLMLHELMHLQMNAEASAVHANKLVTSTAENRLAFNHNFAAWNKQLLKRLPHSKVNEFMNQLMQGLVLQLMNCPLDLFVEQRLYDKYPIARAIQLLSLMEQETQNIQAIRQSAGHLPPAIVRASKIMNIVSSMHIEHLYGLRFYQEYKPTRAEFELAKDLYDEYQAYHDYKPGEEYELVMYFAEALGMEQYLTLVDEDEYRNIHCTEPEEEPKDDGLSTEQKARQDEFYAKHKDGEDPMQTMMMTMYMVGALEYFEGQTKQQVRQTAMEIAMIGAGGISPEKRSGYRVPSIPDKDFGGYQLLAYYYVSFALAAPEVLPSLQLPFDSAWKAAQQMWEARKKRS